MNKLLSRAMFLLARRDHSEHELRRKLAMPPTFPTKRRYTKNSSKQFDEKQSNVFSQQTQSPDKHHRQTVNEDDIERVIQYCYEHNWLNDQKFTVTFMHSYANKGYGPRRIQLELQKKGINRELITLALTECDIDWQEYTHRVLIKRFKPPFCSDRKSKLKVVNYLMYKGFHLEDINDVLKSLAD